MSYIVKYNKSMSCGYNWCDHCDENVFEAVTCPTCQQPARFVATEPPEPASRQLSPQPPVKKIAAAEWFRLMREAVNNAK
jgi:hypothetical protein